MSTYNKRKGGQVLGKCRERQGKDRVRLREEAAWLQDPVTGPAGKPHIVGYLQTVSAEGRFILSRLSGGGAQPAKLPGEQIETLSNRKPTIYLHAVKWLYKLSPSS